MKLVKILLQYFYLLLFPFSSQCRPHISWVHNVSAQNYSVAATAAVNHGYTETRISTAVTLLSIAKISAMLASTSTSTSRSSKQQSSPLSSSSQRERKCVKHVWVSGSDSVREASANLAVMAAQTLVVAGDEM